MNYHFIIESIDPDYNEQTGKALHALLKTKQLSGELLKSYYFDVMGRFDFFQALNDSYLLYPSQSVMFDKIFIHIECHGYLGGVTLKNDDRITWRELAPYIRPFAEKSNINNIIVSSCCFGITAFSIFDFKEGPAPYYLIIGPKKEIHSYNLYEFNRDLMTIFYQSRSLAETLKILEDQYSNTIKLVMAEQQFLTTIKMSLDEKGNFKSSIKNKQKIKKVLKTFPRRIRDQKIRNYKKQREPFQYFETAKKIFFLTDKYPENKERFQIEYKDILSAPNVKGDD